MTKQQEVVIAAIKATIGKRGQPSAYRLAQELGVTEATVSNWKNGRVKPSSDHFVALLQRAQAAGMYIM